MFVAVVIAIFLILATLLKVYSKFSVGRCTSHACLIGKTALITGGNSGIGYQTALALAGRGCRVIIADKDNCDKTKEQIINETGNSNVVTKYFDLASLDSVRKLAKDINKTEERLDILINNAGTSGLGNSYTQDGLLIGMQVNHFGAFLLTHLLVDLLKKSKPSRIIFVSSIGAFFGMVNSKKLNSPTIEFLIYTNSKLCNLITANEFARRLKGTGVTSNSLHPGLVSTPIFKKYFFGDGKKNWLRALTYLMYTYIIERPFSKTPEEGAQTTLHLAMAKEVENVTGEYFWDCRAFWQPVLARNPRYAKAIWENSENLVKLLPEERL